MFGIVQLESLNCSLHPQEAGRTSDRPNGGTTDRPGNMSSKQVGVIISDISTFVGWKRHKYTETLTSQIICLLL